VLDRFVVYGVVLDAGYELGRYQVEYGFGVV
jgi:hypothetical protein